MKIAHREGKTLLGGDYKHRDSKGISFTPLLRGDRGGKDNFEFTIVSVESEYHTPQHHHNFDQIRIMLEGEFGYAKGKVQKPGTIGYFCEGTYYKQDCDSPSETLILQNSGPSGSKFLDYEELKKATDDLVANGTGEFKGGIYTWVDDSGQRHNQDGHEAVWEHRFKQKIQYPKPRFDGPIIMNVENFTWLKHESQSGVNVRHLGSFQERYTCLNQWRINAGVSFELPPTPARQLLFVLEGEGSINGEAIHLHSAVKLEADEKVTINAVEELTLQSIGLPQYAAEPA